ncbi:hypothetical protein EZS27_020532 [termite gut metagenome]|uniref:Leucine-rich repeat domain-containing protein n=1 Tax=termite gut metagenome TaxID=433724 RepID=A0A5J4RD47_9ZZZZ
MKRFIQLLFISISLLLISCSEDSIENSSQKTPLTFKLEFSKQEASTGVSTRNIYNSVLEENNFINIDTLNLEGFVNEGFEGPDYKVQYVYEFQNRVLTWRSVDGTFIYVEDVYPPQEKYTFKMYSGAKNIVKDQRQDKNYLRADRLEGDASFVEIEKRLSCSLYHVNSGIELSFIEKEGNQINLENKLANSTVKFFTNVGEVFANRLDVEIQTKASIPAKYYNHIFRILVPKNSFADDIISFSIINNSDSTDVRNGSLQYELQGGYVLKLSVTMPLNKKEIIVEPEPNLEPEPEVPVNIDFGVNVVLDSLTKGTLIDTLKYTDLSKIESITIKDGLIYRKDFQDLQSIVKNLISLKECDFGNTTFGDDDFYDRFIPNHLFENNQKITRFIFPKLTGSIGDYSFRNCINLSSLVFPSSLEYIEFAAFEGCSNLKGSLNFNEGLTYIGEYAFADCVNITGNLLLPKSLIAIGIAAFFNCSGLGDYIKIEDSVEIIGNYAFSRCSNLISLSITSKTPIGNSSFSRCEKLSDIDISSESIGERAFEDCKKLYRVHIRNSLKRLSERAFLNIGEGTNVLDPTRPYGDASQLIIYFYSTVDVPELNAKVFPTNFFCSVPKGAYNLYKDKGYETDKIKLVERTN